MVKKTIKIILCLVFFIPSLYIFTAFGAGTVVSVIMLFIGVFQMFYGWLTKTDLRGEYSETFELGTHILFYPFIVWVRFIKK